MGNTCSGAGNCTAKQEESEIVTNVSSGKECFDPEKVQFSSDPATIKNVVKIQSHIRGRQARQNLKGGRFMAENLVEDDELEIVKEFVGEVDGTVYSGQVKKGTAIKEGYGEQREPEGSRYFGLWADDKQEGLGRKVYIDGDVYDGYWAHGMANGFGIYRCSDYRVYKGTTGEIKHDGTSYEGFWKDDEWDDFGVHRRADGQVYTGEMKHGQMDGFGEFIFADGIRYIGEYRENEIEGFGVTIQRQDNTIFAGLWASSVKQGQGTYVWSQTGRAYVGEYQADLKHGQGIYFFDDGRAYVGGWVNGQQHGIGYIIFPNQKIHKQNFEQGKRKERLYDIGAEENEQVKQRLEEAHLSVQNIHAQVQTQEEKMAQLKGDFEGKKPKMPVKQFNQQVDEAEQLIADNSERQQEEEQKDDEAAEKSEELLVEELCEKPEEAGEAPEAEEAAAEPITDRESDRQGDDQEQAEPRIQLTGYPQVALTTVPEKFTAENGQTSPHLPETAKMDQLADKVSPTNQDQELKLYSQDDKENNDHLDSAEKQ